MLYNSVAVELYSNHIITGSSRHPMDKLMKKLRKSRKWAKVRGCGRVRA